MTDQILFELKVDSRGVTRGVTTATRSLGGLETRAEAAGMSLEKLGRKVQGVETALRTGTLTTLRDTARATDTLTRAFKAAATPEDRQRFAALRVEVKRLERQLLADGAAFDSFRDRATTAARVAREQFRRYRTSIRETTRAVRRDVVGVGRDLARGLIDEAEANRRLAAIENRFQAYVRRVRTLGEAAGVATKPLNREFARALQTVNREVAETERRASGLIAQLREQNSVVGRLSRNLRGALVGAYIAVGLVLTNTLQRAFGDVVRGAVAFDDALVDVGARTGLTGLKLARLGGDIRGLSRRLGLGATDLLAYAETAGQLGIQGRDNILAFVATAARLERVSDLSSDEAAESLAKIAAAFQLPITEAERYASAFNELGNVTAAQSGEIIDAVRRTGAAGRSFGLTVDQVAALNAVLIEAGIESRTAGTSVRNALTIIQTKADEVSETLGVTQAQFSALVQEDALGTLRRYLETLGELDSQARTIEIEAVFGRENLLSVETLATSTERLNAVLSVSASAYQEGTSLTREFDATLESVARQFEIFRARAGATAGVILLRFIPVVENALKQLNRLLGGTEALGDELGRLGASLGDLDSALDLTQRYDDLVAKTNRSTEETADLERITEQLAGRFPDLVRAYDAAGNATEIYTGKVRLAVEAQRALLREQERTTVRNLGQTFERGVRQRSRAEEIREATEQGEVVAATDQRQVATFAGGGAPLRVQTATDRDLAQTAEQNRLFTEGREKIEEAALALTNFYDVADAPDADRLIRDLGVTREAAEELRVEFARLAKQADSAPPPVGDPSAVSDAEEGTDGNTVLPGSAAAEGVREQARAVLQAQEQAAEARAQLLAEERRAEIKATQDGLQRRVALIDLEYDERLRRERVRVAEQIQQQQTLIEEATTEQVRAQARANLAAFRAQEAQLDALYGEGGAARQLEISAVLDLDVDLDEVVGRAEQAGQAVSDSVRAQMALIDDEVDTFIEGLSSDSDVIAAELQAGVLDSIDEIDFALAGLNAAFESATTDQARTQIQQLIDALRQLRGEMEGAAQGGLDLSGTFRSGVADGIAVFASTLGEALAGTESFAEIPKALLSTLAGLAVQIGQQLIAFGAASLALRSLLTNPFAAIAAGAALIALGAAAQASIRGTLRNGQASTPASTGGSSIPDEAVPLGGAGLLDQPGGVTPRNRGGRVSRGRPYLVGDRKASDPRGAIVPGVTELFVPDESGFVVPGNTLQTAIDAVRAAAPVGGFQPPGPEVARMLGGGASMPAPSVNVTAPSIPAPRVVPMLRGTELVALVEYVQERNGTSFGSYSSGGEG